MERSTDAAFNAQVVQEACEWLVEFRSGDIDIGERRRFNAWLHASPGHVRAYLELVAIWNESAQLDRNEKWTTDTLIAQAATDPGNLVPLGSHPVPSFHGSGEGRARSSGRVRYLLAACVLLALAGVWTWSVTPLNSYFTVIGEQRSIVLPDGSTVDLNSRSRIRVRYSEHERAVELQEGQALFEVAKNPNRPFIVSSGKTRVRAVGTRFDVYRKTSGTTVTVIEGRVAVTSPLSVTGKERGVSPFPSSTPGEAKEPAQPKSETLPLRARADEPGMKAIEVFLSAGEQLRLASNTVPHPIPADVGRATAWTHRQLVFDSTPLAEVAEEFNRYNQRQLVIRSATLNNFQIDGVFSSTDPASLIRFLRTRPGVHVIETGVEIAIASR